jgi:hypothetical protein
VVLPEQDAVIAITSGLRDMQAVLNLVWDKLLPAMKPTTLGSNKAAEAELRKQLAALTIRLPTGAGKPSESVGKRFVFEANERKIEAATLTAADEKGERDSGLVLTLKIDGAEQRILCGNERWEKSKFAFGPFVEQPAAASGAWTADDTYTAKFCFYETPFIVTVECRFKGDELKLTSQANVGFGPQKPVELVGKPQ